MSGIRRQGRPASPGMAWGPIWRWPEPERHAAAYGPPQGAAELRAAIARGRSELESEVAAQEGDAAEILAVQLALLEDDTLAAPAFAVLAGPAAPAAAVAWRAALEVEIAGYQASDEAAFRARAADLILCAADEHRRHVLAWWPELGTERVRLFNESIAGRAPMDVDDPYGWDAHVFMLAARVIDRAMDAWADEIARRWPARS